MAVFVFCLLGVGAIRESPVFVGGTHEPQAPKLECVTRHPRCRDLY